MFKKRVVLDTNVMISSLIAAGNSYIILNKVLESRIDLFISYEQFRELHKVLNYDRLGFTFDEKLLLESLILDNAVFITPKEKLNVITRDPSDNMILECAIEGKVEFIVTGIKTY